MYATGNCNYYIVESDSGLRVGHVIFYGYDVGVEFRGFTLGGDRKNWKDNGITVWGYIEVMACYFNSTSTQEENEKELPEGYHLEKMIDESYVTMLDDPFRYTLFPITYTL